MSLLVRDAALFMSVQDLGRNDYLRYGLPHSGPMDWWAFRAANQLVGNEPGAPCVEIGMTSCAIGVEWSTLIAVCGTGYRLYRNQQSLPLWMSFLVKPGDQLVLEKTDGGNWVYLAVGGGVRSEEYLGSCSVYPRANLGWFLKEGDVLNTKPMTSAQRASAGQSWPGTLLPSYDKNPEVCVIPGPNLDRLEDGQGKFWSNFYKLTINSDRMGYRLEGPHIEHTAGADIVSRGMALGEIQVPADGQPIVMMADHPTTGGYTSIGVIVKVDLPLLAQAQPGTARVRFTKVDVVSAQDALIGLIRKMKEHDEESEDLWLSL